MVTLNLTLLFRGDRDVPEILRDGGAGLEKGNQSVSRASAEVG
jgi:hypothetical protein